ncbi:MAG: glucose-1-phosphate thymidylyltransferase [Bdellovibrio sp.]|nr:MAG: glucose-1-phosphate thymidylyltransferase [Bdellovibrio sp.]
MKGIVLAGGNGTRLFPSTKSVSKQLLPVYDKPTIYYPLSIQMLAGIKDILIISTPRDIPMIQSLLGDGQHLGIKLSYAIQEKPEGIAQAFLIGEDFIRKSPVCLILGDNLFFGLSLTKKLEKAAQLKQGAEVFAYHVSDPERYGVVEFNEKGQAINIEEKPQNPKSNWAVTGLYFYDGNVVDYAKTLKPSARGELEITDLNKIYLDRKELKVCPLGRGITWLDTGTEEALLQSSQFVQTIEKRQGLKIACLEEIAFKKGFISQKQLEDLIESYPNCGYRNYLLNFVKYNLNETL